MWNVKGIFLRLLLPAISVIVSACNPLASKNSVDTNFNPGLGTSTNATIAIVPLISFTAPLNGSFVNAATDSAVFPVLGNCDQSGEIVTVKLDGVTIGSPVCTGVSFSTTMNTTGLAISAHTLTASISNAVGTSTASSSFSRDITAPAAAATALGWVQASPYNSPTATWTLSTALDIANQQIQFYTGVCAVANGALVNLNSATATTFNYSNGSDTTTATYKVITYDAAGNSITSACSSGIVIDKTAPSVSLTGLTGGGLYKGGSVQNITWTATDANFGATPITLQYSPDSGASWFTISAALANTGTYAWTLPAGDAATYRVRISASDTAGNGALPVTGANFTIDSSAPTLTSGGFSLNGGSGTTAKNNITVSLQSSDNLSNITHFCLKYNDTTAPAASSSCWTAVNAPYPNLSPALTLNLSNFGFMLGFVPAAYNVYAWTKDAVGNISTLTNAGAGTVGQDKFSITYTPGTPSVITDILATNTDAPSSPPSAGDLTVTSGSSVYIKWKATDDAALPAGSVSLYYTTDDSNFTLIASGLNNSANGACSVNNAGTTADDNDTGCYLWASGSPTSSYYKIRVAVTDASGIVTFASSVPINVATAVNIVAGNTDPGIGASAASAIFAGEKSNTLFSDPQSFVVTRNGIVYYRDINLGILTVNPADGLVKIFIPKTGVISGDGGNIASATIREAYKLMLDNSERLIFWDYDRIRRIDTTVTPMTISTIIGGGGSTADGVAGTSVNLTNLGALGNSNQAPKIPLFMNTPNGDIYYTDKYYTTPAAGWRVRKYTASTGLMSSIYASGSGYDAFPAQDVTLCGVSTVGVMYNPLTSALTKLMISNDSNAPCGWSRNSNLDPVTGVATAPHPPQYNGNGEYMIYKFTGRDGNLYAVYRYSSIIKKYDSGTNTWVNLAGTGANGSCADGTVATSCKMDVWDVFVNESGMVFFVDRGVIRVIDSAGNVRTVMGQSLAYGDGGLATSARLNTVNGVDRTNAGKVILFDSQEVRFREISTTGIISTIAGNGVNGNPNTTTSAAAQQVNNYEGYSPNTDNFVVNPATGDVFYQRLLRVSKLDRASDRWVDLTSGATSYLTSDGNLGSTIGPALYDPPRIFGFDGTNVLAAMAGYSADAYLKLYTAANGTQSNLAGNATANGNYCTDGTTTATCQVPVWSAHARATWDSYAVPNRWAVLKPGTNAIRGLQIGSTMTTIATLATTATSFVYRHDASNNIVYYCSNTDYKIHKKDITGATDVALTWPISSMKCTGRSMVYDSVGGKLIFPFTQNGLAGIAEYVNP